MYVLPSHATNKYETLTALLDLSHSVGIEPVISCAILIHRLMR